MTSILGFFSGLLNRAAQKHDLDARRDTASRHVFDQAKDPQVRDVAERIVRRHGHIEHLPEGIRISVRYFVRVSMPGYTVDLHFYPGAGSR